MIDGSVLNKDELSKPKARRRTLSTIHENLLSKIASIVAVRPIPDKGI